MSFRIFWNRFLGRTAPRFDSHLREVRESAGVSVEELASHCRVSDQTIELIEDARYEPSVVLAEQIARRLNTSVESLFTAHQPTPAPEEERLKLKLGRAGLWGFYLVIFGSLIAANIFFFEDHEIAGEALGAVWAVGAIFFMILASRIPGFWRFQRQRNRTQPKPVYWFAVIGSPILFATLMQFMPSHEGESPAKRIASFFFYAIFWGGWMYWLQYRKVKSSAK